jgi:hypothetical protein
VVQGGKLARKIHLVNIRIWSEGQGWPLVNSGSGTLCALVEMFAFNQDKNYHDQIEPLLRSCHPILQYFLDLHWQIASEIE